MTLSKACPRCASPLCRAHGSVIERMWKPFTLQRIFLCDACGYRGWMVPVEKGYFAPVEELEPLDLATLDSVMSRPEDSRKKSLPEDV